MEHKTEPMPVKRRKLLTLFGRLKLRIALIFSGAGKPGYFVGDLCI